MKISDLLDVIEDDTVPIREKSIIASERIMEVTMRKIHTDTDTNVTAGRKRRRGAVALLIAAVVLALSATAYASGLFSRLVNWQGQTAETETEPMATVPPDAVMYGDEARDAAIASLLEQRGDRELMIVRDGGRASSAERIAPLASVEELAELLMREDSALTLPVTVPEGYTLVTGRVSYESAPGYGYTLEAKETREDGLTVERYSAPPEGDFISGYTLEWENEAGELIYLQAHMMEDAENTEFGVWGDNAVYRLTVDGMDDALGIQGEGSSTVWLRQRLASPVLCESRMAMLLREPDIDIPRPFPDETARDIIYKLCAQGLSVDELQAMLVT